MSCLRCSVSLNNICQDFKIKYINKKVNLKVQQTTIQTNESPKTKRLCIISYPMTNNKNPYQDLLLNPFNLLINALGLNYQLLRI